MAVSTDGLLYEYGKSLEPVLVEPKDTDGNVVKLGGKIVEVYPGGKFYIVQLEDKSFYLICKLIRPDFFKVIFNLLTVPGFLQTTKPKRTKKACRRWVLSTCRAAGLFVVFMQARNTVSW